MDFSLIMKLAIISKYVFFIRLQSEYQFRRQRRKPLKKCCAMLFRWNRWKRCISSPRSSFCCAAAAAVWAPAHISLDLTTTMPINQISNAPAPPRLLCPRNGWAQPGALDLCSSLSKRGQRGGNVELIWSHKRSDTPVSALYLLIILSIASVWLLSAG